MQSVQSWRGGNCLNFSGLCEVLHHSVLARPLCFALVAQAAKYSLDSLPKHTDHALSAEDSVVAGDSSDIFGDQAYMHDAEGGIDDYGRDDESKAMSAGSNAVLSPGSTEAGAEVGRLEGGGSQEGRGRSIVAQRKPASPRRSSLRWGVANMLEEQLARYMTPDATPPEVNFH